MVGKNSVKMDLSGEITSPLERACKTITSVDHEFEAESLKLYNKFGMLVKKIGD